MRVISLATIAVIAITQMASAQQQSAEAVAAAILTGFVQQDATLIAPHGNAQNVDFFAEILAGTEDPAELFGGTRGEAARAWDGMILPARYEDDHAYVAFSIEGLTGPAALGSGQPGRFMVVTLELDGGDDTTWGLEDLNFIAREDYIARAEVQP